MTETRPIGVIFGAGNIGKGLAGELFQGAGLLPTFIEADPAVVKSLSAMPEYALHIHAGESTTERRVGPFEICAAGSPEARAALRRASVCATAVGPTNLQAVGRALAAACGEREDGPWNVLVCENYRHGAEDLRARLSGQDGAPGCLQCSVERIVVGAETDEEGLLRVHAEGRSPLFAASGNWQGPLPDWPGLRFVEDVGAYFDRKKYTNNFGHAVLGYLGALKGYRYVWQAAEDDELASLLAELLDRICAGLAREYDAWSRDDLEDHKRLLLQERFSNRAVGDTIERVCRDPSRKLGPEERIIGALRLLRRHGQPTDGFGRLIGAAALFAMENETDCWPAPDAGESALTEALAAATTLERSSPLIREAVDFVQQKGDV